MNIDHWPRKREQRNAEQASRISIAPGKVVRPGRTAL
jgi:hypothetical protein